MPQIKLTAKQGMGEFADQQVGTNYVNLGTNYVNLGTNYVNLVTNFCRCEFLISYIS